MKPREGAEVQLFFFFLTSVLDRVGAWGSVVVKALRN
jgi:hypothetical protein